MATKVRSEQKLREIEEIAAGWGKLLALESFAEGPGLDLSLADMENIVARASRAIVAGCHSTPLTLFHLPYFLCQANLIWGGGDELDWGQPLGTGGRLGVNF